MFQKAQRKKAKIRLALCGPSGAGKTYSSLLIGRGLAPTGKIAMIDTERGSGELYSDLLEYDVATLTPPFSPERYIKLIQEAERAGYDVLIIDNLSHAWVGQGGVLELHDRATAANKGNSFTAWREITPQHNALVDAMLNANMHIITTMRTKTAYEIVDNDRGKKAPIKIGLAPVQREGMEYEFTIVLDLTVDQHIATAAKDRTSLFDGQHFVPSIETGQHILRWLDSGYDAEAASKQHLSRLSEMVQAIGDNVRLNEFWRECATARQVMTTADVATLTGLCAEQRGKIQAEAQAQKGISGENQAPGNRPQTGTENASGGPEGSQNPPPGTPPGAPTAAVDAPQDQTDDTPSEEAINEVLSLAREAGVTDERLAAWTSTATNGVTNDLQSVSHGVLAAVRHMIVKQMTKPNVPATVTGDIIPDGYAVNTQVHIFDAGKLAEGRFTEV